jgi:hypothetical protein
MRTLLILALVLSRIRLATAADSCVYGFPTPYDKVLTSDELKAVLANRPGTDVVLREAAAGQTVRPSPPVSRGAQKRAVPITSEQAERLIVLGTIRIVQTLREGTVYLRSRTGHLYVVKPQSDERLRNAVAAVDPCHIFITVLTW